MEQSRKKRSKWRVKEQKENKRRLMVEKEEEEQRQMRLLDTVQKKQKEKEKEEEEEGENEEDDCNVCEPKAKRRKIEPSQEKSVITQQSPQSMVSHQGASTELMIAVKEEEEDEIEPENERPVPGMSGLSVEFVRDAFYSSSENNDNEEMKNGDSNYFVEEIYSDRLASGR